MKGVCNQTVKSPQDILNTLKSGALNRTTAATNMNQQSSRSHAIFSISIKQQRMAPVDVSFSGNFDLSEAIDEGRHDPLYPPRFSLHQISLFTLKMHLDPRVIRKRRNKLRCHYSNRIRTRSLNRKIPFR